ncbi:MAG: hypothetical protein LAN64_13430, partial [Acidobacteriia bacterium]|nr:hypothetical protein [Terriglobia bacterium]
MVNFSEGQFMGQPSPITDEDLATVALFLHRANSFQALLEREAGVLEKVTPREKGETGDGNEAGTRGYLTRVSSKSEFKEAIEKFEADEGPLWGRDTIAHTP